MEFTEGRIAGGLDVLARDREEERQTGSIVQDAHVRRDGDEHMPPTELRTTRLPVEVRAVGGSSRTIGGYASVFGCRSEPLPFIEMVDPHAFNKSRGDGWSDVVCRWNHKDDFL